jgi:pyrimidine deaminase RibD-like protein
MKIGSVAGPAELNRAMSAYQTNPGFSATRNAAGLPQVGAIDVAKNPAVAVDISHRAKQLHADMQKANAGQE